MMTRSVGTMNARIWGRGPSKGAISPSCITMAEPPGASFSFRLNRHKLRQVRQREGRYLLRTNLCGREPAELWRFYIQLVEIEAAFKNLKESEMIKDGLSAPLHAGAMKYYKERGWQ